MITAADDYVGDVYVEGERITLIGESLDVQADKVIDATGKYVLPGAVDPHTHLDMPFGGTVTVDDVESGQTAAALDPKSERPKRAPSSSAQLTSRTVTGGLPCSAIRRSTSAPATTFNAPSNQPPLGTESRWPPIRSSLSDRPRSVHH